MPDSLPMHARPTAFEPDVYRCKPTMTLSRVSTTNSRSQALKAVGASAAPQWRADHKENPYRCVGERCVAAQRMRHRAGPQCVKSCRTTRACEWSEIRLLQIRLLRRLSVNPAFGGHIRSCDLCSGLERPHYSALCRS